MEQKGSVKVTAVNPMLWQTREWVRKITQATRDSAGRVQTPRREQDVPNIPDLKQKVFSFTVNM